MIDFDKELDRILHVLQNSDNGRNVVPIEAKQAIKQAVDKYVIGEDEELVWYERRLPRNELRAEQRKSLWGTTKEEE